MLASPVSSSSFLTFPPMVTTAVGTIPLETFSSIIKLNGWVPTATPAGSLNTFLIKMDPSKTTEKQSVYNKQEPA